MDSLASAGLLFSLHDLLHELILFSGFWYLVGAVDEIALDLAWLKMRLSGKLRPKAAPLTPGSKRIAVFIPAWHEADVIRQTVQHCLKVWPHAALRVYVGCYRNDASTLAAAIAASADSRLRIVVHDRDGPTSKADCLNRLWEALLHDEARAGQLMDGVLLHDAEDLVHPEALDALAAALTTHDFVQLPVEPLIDWGSRWIAGHYADEFAEAHGKAMPVRSALGAAIPAAGVGCCFSRPMLDTLAARRRQAGSSGPFAADCLTEDYELGLMVAEEGGASCFLSQLATDGGLVATRAYFPADLQAAVVQKTRWLHGIAFQGWERLGWPSRLIDIWMRLRDRRGPLAALVMTTGYLAMLLWAALTIAGLFLTYPARPLPTVIIALLWINLASLVWRLVMRFHFTSQLYGWREGILAVARMPVANIIAIMSGWRALWHYLRSLAGQPPRWNKTSHRWPADLQIGSVKAA